MKFYRCKCGRMRSYGSEPPADCQSCPDCKTTLEQSPEDHHAPGPHLWTTNFVSTDYGKLPFTFCARCLFKKGEAE